MSSLLWMNVELEKWYVLYSSFTGVDPKRKLQEEVDEFMAAETPLDELAEGADVMIVVLTQLYKQGWSYSDVLMALETKLDTNLHRKWKRMPDGTIHHI